MARRAPTRHHFGYADRAPGRQAGAGGRRVPFRRAPLRPDERPDVGRPAPRLEGRAGDRGQPAAKPTRPFALLDLAGGTGDVAFRVVEAGGAGTRVTVCDINADMLAVGARARARARARRRASPSSEGNAEELAYPDRSFDCVTIAFGIRNVPRIERALAKPIACSSIGGRFLCLEFSSVDVPGLDALYELYSFNVIPAHRPRRDRRPRGLSVSGRIDPQISQAEGLRADDRGRRLPPRLVHAHDRRRRGAAFAAGSL